MPKYLGEKNKNWNLKIDDLFELKREKFIWMQNALTFVEISFKNKNEREKAFILQAIFRTIKVKKKNLVFERISTNNKKN